MLSRRKDSCHTEGMKENCLITSAFIYFMYQAHIHTSILGEQRHTGIIILESGAGKRCPSVASLAHSKRTPRYSSAVPDPRALPHREVNSSPLFISR